MVNIIFKAYVRCRFHTYYKGLLKLSDNYTCNLWDERLVSYYPQPPFNKFVGFSHVHLFTQSMIAFELDSRVELHFKVDNHSNRSFILFCSPSIFNYRWPISPCTYIHEKQNSELQIFWIHLGMVLWTEVNTYIHT